MFGLKTSRKGAQPLATLESVETQLATRPKLDAIGILQELSALSDALFANHRIAPGQAFDIADLIDRTCRPHFRKVSHEYILGSRRLTKYQDDRIWNTVSGYLGQLVHMYRFCLAQYEVGLQGGDTLRRQLPIITARAVRACAGRLKWCYLRYRAIEPEQWSELASLYLVAEAAGFSREALTIYRGAAQPSTVEQEFLRALMLAIASPDSLLPEQIEVAERLLAHCSPHFLITTRPTPELRHYIELRSDSGPHRLPLAGRMLVTARAFGAGDGVDELHNLLGRLDDGRLTRSELGLSQEFELEVIRSTAHHLLRHWSPPLQERRSSREREIEQVTVVYDFDEVVAKAGALALSSPFMSEQETWTVDDHSAHGLRARVSSPLGRWLEVGRLIAFREADDALWTVGLVRRIKREPNDTRHVAVETFARGGAAVTVVPRVGSRSKETDPGVLSVLLPGADGVSDQVTLLSPPGTYSTTMPLQMRAYDHAYLLIPVELTEAGGDYQIARYKILKST